MKNIMAIPTTVISPAEAAKDGFYKWLGAKNDTEFKGIIPGYICGFCVEMKNSNGELGYCSCVYLNDYENILLPEDSYGNLMDTWNDLGISVAGCRAGWEPTGRIVFRGYHTEVWIPEEREYGYEDASKEVEDLFAKYVSGEVA